VVAVPREAQRRFRPHTAFLKAPRLQSVYLTDVDYRPFSSKTLLPWDQLTTGSGVGHSRCHILSQTPNLVHSRLDLTPGPLTTNLNPHHATSTTGDEPLGDMLTCQAELPALRCVEIVDSTWGVEVLDLGESR
jgi:hypothetical protein